MAPSFSNAIASTLPSSSPPKLPSPSTSTATASSLPPTTTCSSSWPKGLQRAPSSSPSSKPRGAVNRGDRGNPQRGGLYLSLGLRPNLPAAAGARLTLGSAWGLATLLRAQGFPVSIKWPNDLVLQGKKLGGILTESKLRGGIIHQAVVGLGLNWRNPVPEGAIALGSLVPLSQPSPQPIPQPIPTHSIRLGEPPPRIEHLETLAAIALQGLILGYCRWCHDLPGSASPPLAELLGQYESLMDRLGGPVDLPGQTGIIRGIASTGELKVSINQAEKLFPPGTIKLGYD